MTPEEMRAEADRLRARSEEIAADNPTAAGYHADRAAWLEYLARAEEDRRAGDARGGDR